MLYKVFDFADKEVHEVMVPRPEVVALSIDLPPAGVPRGGHRLAVHALPGLPRLARRRASASCTCATSSRRSTTAGSTTSSSRGSFRPAHVVPETKDLAAMLAEFRRTEPAHGARRRRVRRRSRGSSRSKTCSRRSSARSRTSTTSRTSRSSAVDEQPHPDRRHVPDRRLQRGVQGRPAAGGLPHGRRLRLRRARARGREGRRGPPRRHAVPGPRRRRPAHRAARGRVPLRRSDTERSSQPQSRISLRCSSTTSAFRRPQSETACASSSRSASGSTSPGDHPYRVEWLWYEPDSPEAELIRTVPHVAYLVESLEDAMEGENDDRGAVRRLRGGSCGVHRSRRRSG